MRICECAHVGMERKDKETTCIHQFDNRDTGLGDGLNVAVHAPFAESGRQNEEWLLSRSSNHT